MRIATPLVFPVLLIACEPAATPAPMPETDLPLMGSYRAEGDQCVRVGENAYTNQFLDDAADLVACPAEYEGIGVFVTETGAIEVDRVDEYILYTVPRR